MANVFSPNGFVPVRRQDGAAWSANMSSYLIKSDNTNKFYAGDPIVRISTGYIDVNTSSSTAVSGIFVGCRYLSTAQGRVVWSPQFAGADAAADVTAYVVDDPNVVMQVWAGTGATPGTAGSLLFADLGQNIGYRQGAGNTLSGISGAYVDAATKNTTSTLPFSIIGFATLPPGVNGSDTLSSGALLEVTFNAMLAQRAGATGV